MASLLRTLPSCVIQNIQGRPTLPQACLVLLMLHRQALTFCERCSLFEMSDNSDKQTARYEMDEAWRIRSSDARVCSHPSSQLSQSPLTLTSSLPCTDDVTRASLHFLQKVTLA